MPLDTRLTRVDANRVQIDNPRGIDAVLFANEQVPVQTAAVVKRDDSPGGNVWRAVAPSHPDWET